MKTGQSPLNKSEKAIVINYSGLNLNGILGIPHRAKGIVVFAHGSGSSRWSSRNLFVARELQKTGMATLLIDLLTESEEEDRGNVFNVELLALRLISAKHWLEKHLETTALPIGYFGASTGAGAALVAAAMEAANVFAVVSRGGRPDLADKYLKHVAAPTLLLVGSLDTSVIELNREAYARLHCEKKMELIPGATHLFEEAGTLEQVSRLSTQWFSSKVRGTFLQRTADKQNGPEPFI